MSCVASSFKGHLKDTDASYHPSAMPAASRVFFSQKSEIVQKNNPESKARPSAASPERQSEELLRLTDHHSTQEVIPEDLEQPIGCC